MIAVQRTSEAPRSLVESRAENRYRNADVIDQLFKDFHGKCYICEVFPVDDPEVEHRLPHKNGKHPDRKYRWDNLFYCCRHCNSVKAKPKYDEGIIDCCARDPEALLKQKLVENRVCIEAFDAEDAEARLTAELIEEVFMTDNPTLRKHAADARLNKLQERMNALYERLREYIEGDNKRFAERTIAAMLKRDAAFAGFTRWYVREHLDDYPEFRAYLE